MGVTDSVADELSVSPARIAFRRFRDHRLGMFSLIGLVALALVAAAAPFTAPYDPAAIDLKASRVGPSLQHLLGTDISGRDVLSRLIYGARVSLSVGVAAALISSTVGVTLGLTAGLLRGAIDAVIMRTTEIILSFPVLILLIVTAILITPGAPSVIIGVGIFSWPLTCRIVRGLVLSLREQDFVLAARALGAGNRRLVRRHLLPMVIAPVIVATTLLVADAILLEAALSYLGFGIRPPQPSLGAMLNDAQDITVLGNMPWLWVPPGLVIALTVLAVNLVGDALRDAFDPRQLVRHAPSTSVFAPNDASLAVKVEDVYSSVDASTTDPSPGKREDG